MNYRQARAYLDSLDFRGMRLGLQNTEKLLSRLGNPHANFPIAHIAGTNGKGSTSTILATILAKAGLKTGLYVSPHLETFRERIQINGEMIGQKEAAGLVAETRAAAEEGNGAPVTYFEFMTAMAFLHFSRCGVDAAVIEVGMGGRFDSTNVVDPALSIITSVAMDHRKHLGASLKSIAREKCGIIKQGRPLVCGVRDPEIAETVLKQAKSKSAPPWFIRRDFFNRRLEITERGERFDFRSPLGTFKDVEVSLPGRQQVDNASMAIMASLLLRENGFAIDDGAIREGVADVKCPARFEVFSRSPLVILDGAHNTKAASALRSTLLERFGPGRVDIVFGAMRDKDYKRMIKTLKPAAKSFSFYQAGVPRAASLKDMMNGQIDPPTSMRALEKPEDVVKLIEKARKDAVFVVTGSFYTIGEIRAVLREALFGAKSAT